MNTATLRKLTALGISSVCKLIALIELAEDDHNPTSLAASCGCSAASITDLVDSMVSSGLVTRTHSAADRRMLVISLTEKGREAAALLKP
jgi:DNA-binding MarR family transcriptional regulator